MKSNAVAAGQTGFSEQYDALRSDAYGGSQLLAHQQLGVLALGTNPANTKTWTLTINGTAVTGTFVSSIGSTAGNVLIGASAAATAQNLLNLLQNPQTTTSTSVALSSANIALTVFCGYALNGTSITIYSLNSATYAPLTSFTASTTATSDSYTANTMALYIEPGTYYIGTTQVKFAGGNTPTITAPSTHPRIDLVTVDSSGAIALTTGSEGVSPAVPTYPTNKIVVCEIFNEVGETIIRDWNDGTQGYIQADARPFNSIIYINSNSQIAAGVINASNLANAGTCATGSIVMWAAAAGSPPSGWLTCDGSAVSRSTYATLFALISTTFGSGDGSTTFNLPDFRGNVPVGYKNGDANFGTLGQTGGEVTHTLLTAETPAHTHIVGEDSGGGGSGTNVLATTAVASKQSGDASHPGITTTSIGSGTAHNNLQPYLAINFIIKN